MKLIIVESPTKARTLSKFLGSGYLILASMGHVRDLPKSTLGVDLEHDFTPSYIVPRDKTKNVNALKDAAKKSESVILATDPDREGEAIAFHIAEILKTEGAKKAGKKNTKQKDGAPQDGSPFNRIAFHEITESAIRDALDHPRELDMKLVDAQQARRVLDRLVGYKLSPLLWKKLSKRWLSAGRVQSVAVRLIVEREREIQKFARIEYWTVDGRFQTRPEDGGDWTELTAQLVGKDGIRYEKTLSFPLFDGKYTTTSSALSDEQKTKEVIADLKPAYTVTAVDTKDVRRSPLPPYTTSTLQQDAGRRLYFSSKKTMQLAQKLYEEGYITYHRTDSVNLSDKFITEARLYVRDVYGSAYIPSNPRLFKTKSKVAQEAHEAIRPTVVRRTPSDITEPDFHRDHLRLYDLIWKRAVACQAADALFEATALTIGSGNGYEFGTNGSVVKFDGFLKITGRESSESVIPKLTVGQMLNLKETIPTRHDTQPPPRYTEASLVKTLEEKGIGRPSTYAPIISTIVDRQYVTRDEKKFVPTELGFAVTDFLVQYFPDILGLPFTAHMEDNLDEIANGGKEWVPVIREFYEPFSKELDISYQEAEKVKLSEERIDEHCPNCGHDLVIRTGRFGKFIACTNFPECTYTRQYGEKVDIKCPRCGGDMVVKQSRRGKKFYGCSNYPTCTFAAWKKEDIK